MKSLNPIFCSFFLYNILTVSRLILLLLTVYTFYTLLSHAAYSELKKSHGYAGITREEGLQNGQSVISCILNISIKNNR